MNFTAYCFFLDASVSSYLCCDVELFSLHILNNKSLRLHDEIYSFLLNNEQGGSTALHWACKGGLLEVVKDLVAKEADVNAEDSVR